MIEYRQAISLVRSAVSPVEAERVGLLEAVGRVSSEEIETPHQLPEEPVAQTGGYAVESGLSAEAGISRAVPVPIFPGERLPPGTDTILIDDAVDAHNTGTDSTDLAGVSGDFVIKGGDILRLGEIAIPRGRVFGPAEIGLLADFGMRRVGVYKRPHLSVLSVGDDLVKVDNIREPHMRYDWAGALICGAIDQCGGAFTSIGPVSENPEDIEFSVSKGLEEDGLIISTRMGRGRGDALIQILRKQGIDLVFDGVSMYPGGNTILGHIKDRPVLVLPLAVGELLVAAELLMVPFLLRVSGRIRSIRRGISAILEAPLQSPAKNGECLVWGVSVTGDREPYYAKPIPQWPGAACYGSSSIYGLCVSEDGSDQPTDSTVEVLPLLTRIL